MGMEQPRVWIPSIALSGMTFYTGDKFPGWKGNLFVGGLRQGEVPRTGQLQRIEFNDKWEEAAASRCCVSSDSASATCGKDRMAICTC